MPVLTNGPETRRAGSSFYIERLETCVRRAGFPAGIRRRAVPMPIRWLPEVCWSPTLRFSMRS